MMVLNSSPTRLILIPAPACSAAARFCSCAWNEAAPVAQSTVNSNFWPTAMSAPQSPGAVPAFAQTLIPPGFTVHPLFFSRLTAVAGLYGNGSVASAGDSQVEGTI